MEKRAHFLPMLIVLVQISKYCKYKYNNNKYNIVFTFAEAAVSYNHTATVLYRANIRPYIGTNYNTNSNRNFTTKLRPNQYY